MKVINVVGARPNFMKVAPIIEAMNRYPDQIRHLLVHTGQHYDENMSKAFFSPDFPDRSQFHTPWTPILI